MTQSLALGTSRYKLLKLDGGKDDQAEKKETARDNEYSVRTQ